MTRGDSQDTDLDWTDFVARLAAFAEHIQGGPCGAAEASPLRHLQRLIATVVALTRAVRFSDRESCLAIRDSPTYSETVASEADFFFWTWGALQLADFLDSRAFDTLARA
jgi:hypothetical protein